jgi:O-antigen/teichoic acid export membrane protein
LASSVTGPASRAGYVLAVAAQLLGRGGAMAANLASLALAARCLPEAQFSIFVLVTGLVSVLVQIADFGTGPVFGQQAGMLNEQRRLGGGFWGSFLAVRAGLAVLASAIGVALALSLSGPAAWAMLLVSLSAGLVAARFLDPLFQMAGVPWRSSATQLAGAAATLGLAGLAARFHPTLGGFLLAFIAAAAVFCAASLVATRGLVTSPVRVQADTVGRILRLAAPIGVAGLLTAVNGRANLLFLQHFAGPDALADFGAAYRVLDLAVNMAVLVLSPLIPVLSRSAQAGVAPLAASLRGAVRLLLHLALPLLVATPVLSPWVVRALYGTRYAAAADVLDVLALVGFGVVFSLLASYALLALNVTHYAIWITGSSVILNLALNAALVPRAGAMGAAVAAVCSECLLVSLATAALLRHVPGAVDIRASARALGLAAAAFLLLRALPPVVRDGGSLLALLACAAPLRDLWRERRGA